MTQLSVQTTKRSEMLDITRQVADVVRRTGIGRGLCHVFVPHTTAAVTINENADPDVPVDILTVSGSPHPHEGGYRHQEGNTAAHVKASLLGPSETVLIEGGELVLGVWQSLFFCEFDGPRPRKIIVRVQATD
jgi:secondary thiamine-phosphate synthase enzyme